MRMRAIFVAIFVAVVAGTPIQFDGARCVSDLRLGSYNIQHGLSMARTDVNITRTAAEIAILGPDLMGIQEVDNKTTRSIVDESAVISNITHEHCSFAPMRDFQGGYYGISVVSKYQILEEKILRYHRPGHDARPPAQCLDEQIADYCQGALAIRVDPQENSCPNKDGVWFVTTHFGNDNLGAVQSNEATQLVDFIEKELTPPVFLTGDFNSFPDSAAIGLLRSKATDIFDLCGVGSALTFNSSSPTERIDYGFFFSGCKVGDADCNIRIKCNGGSVVVDTTVSDHRPVVFPIQLQLFL